MKADDTDVFATFDRTDDKGEPIICNREKYARAATENGKLVEFITLDELLQLLGTTREELENTTPPDVDYLEARKYGKPINKNTKTFYVPSPVAV